VDVNGPGKYDDLATLVRESSEAEAVIVIVLGGKFGNGFSVQTTRPGMAERLPDLLEKAAAAIRASTTPNQKGFSE